MNIQEFLRPRFNFLFLVVWLGLSLFEFTVPSSAEGTSVEERGLQKGEISRINILYTSNANGFLILGEDRNCDCPSIAAPDGGLARRVQFIKQYRQIHSNVLVLDSGDSLSLYPNPLKSSYIFKTLELIGYDAVTIGDQELTNGPQFFLEAQERYKIPFLAANLKIYDEGSSFQPTSYIIRKVGNYRVAILGVTYLDLSLLLRSQKIQGAETSPWRQALSSYLPLLRERADLIVVLSHLGYNLDKEMAKEFGNIDLIIGGHSQTLLEEPDRVEKSLIVQAGPGGQRVGVLTLTLDRDGRIVDYENQLILLKKTRNDPQVALWRIEYQQELEERNRELLMETGSH